MKLIITVVDNEDVEKLTAALTNQHFGVTRINTSGGLLGPGTSTLLIGLDDEQVEAVITIITELASPHSRFYPYAYTPPGIPPTSFIEVPAGGFMAFVLDVDYFEQV